MLDNYLQQTTSADVIFQSHFFLGILRVKQDELNMHFIFEVLMSFFSNFAYCRFCTTRLQKLGSKNVKNRRKMLFLSLNIKSCSGPLFMYYGVTVLKLLVIFKETDVSYSEITKENHLRTGVKTLLVPKKH